jgi:hypothetical protein
VEKQFPRSGKTEAGGTKVISAWLISCDASLSDNRGQKNAIEQVKKKRPKNPIATLKKNSSNSYRHPSPKDSPLSRTQDRFAREKNRSNKVTRNHMLLQRQRGEGCALLPIAQPNSVTTVTKTQQQTRGGGRGG